MENIIHSWNNPHVLDYNLFLFFLEMGYISHVCRMLQKPSTNSNFGNQTHTNDNNNKIAKKLIQGSNVSQV
jgi:hypothetical protein